MLKRLLIVSGLCLIAASALAAPKKIFVAQLKPTNIEPSVASAIDMAICNTAHADKRFDAACPDEVKSVMQLDSMQTMLGAAPTCAGDDCAQRLAERVKADAMITGTVAKLTDKKFVITLEMLQTADAKSLGRVEEQVAGAEDELYKRAGGATKKLLAGIK